jgi:hypothetical protein
VRVVSPELAEPVAELAEQQPVVVVMGRFAVALAVVPEPVAVVEQVQEFRLSPVLLPLLTPDHRQAQRRPCSLRRCRPL